jgi:hypothetical protein
MACTALYSKDFNVLWIKVNKESSESIAFSSGNKLIVNDPRLSLRQDMNSNRYILQVTRDIIIQLKKKNCKPHVPI